VDGKLACEAELTCMIVPRAQGKKAAADSSAAAAASETV